MAAAILLGSCQNDKEENFDNKAFIEETSMSLETIIKGDAGVVTKTLTIATARPAENRINAKAVVDKSLLATYNKAYYASAELLPDSCYEVVESQMQIDKGNVRSTKATINFQKLGGLNRLCAARVNTNERYRTAFLCQELLLYI